MWSSIRRSPAWCRWQDPRGRFIGQGLLSPASEIRLRLLERTDAPVDAAWWRRAIAAAAARRAGIDATAYRVVHGEGDGLPSLVVDRYDRWLVAQILSAGLETMRQPILDALVAPVPAGGDPAPPRRPRPPAGAAAGRDRGWPPARCRAEIEVREGGVRYLAAPWEGQKTGAFLDQRPNRLLAGEVTRPGGRALDCFAYHGSFALHLAGRAGTVVALDSSPGALERARANAALNGLHNIEWRAADAFEGLRAMARAREQFDTIVLDPPAFAKTRASVPDALRGYREVNLRAMRCLAPGRHPAHCVLLLPRAAARVPHDAGRGRRRQRPAHPGAPHPGPGRGPPRGADHPRDRVPQGGASRGGIARRLDPLHPMYEFAPSSIRRSSWDRRSSRAHSTYTR